MPPPAGASARFPWNNLRELRSERCAARLSDGDSKAAQARSVPRSRGAPLRAVSLSRRAHARPPAGRTHWLEWHQPEGRVPPAGCSAHGLSFINRNELRSECRVETTRPSEEADIETRIANPHVKSTQHLCAARLTPELSCGAARAEPWPR